MISLEGGGAAGRPHPVARRFALATTGYLAAMNVDFTIVIPTIGRKSLRAVFIALAAGDGPMPTEIIVVDDRTESVPLQPFSEGLRTRTLRSGGRGPAAARNRGWRAARSRWKLSVVVRRAWRTPETRLSTWRWSTARYSSSFDEKCWYRTGLLTPARSAISSMPAAW